MGIHYDYKSKRGERAVLKQAKREARLAARKAKRKDIYAASDSESAMHDIQKPITLEDVRKKLEEQGGSIENADIAMIPKSTLSPETSDAKKTLHLLDKLEELEDVQRVYSNIEFKDEILENYAE